MSKTGQMATGQELAAQARIEFADMIDSLSADQVDGQTLCTGWSPHVVAGHVATFVAVPLPKFMFTVAKNRGNFDRASDTMARKLAERPIGELAQLLRDRAMKKPSMPGFPSELNLGDAVVHAQDIRRGLGLDGAPTPELVQASLEFMTTQKQAKLLLEDADVLDGLRFEATDLDWSHGSGELVSGPGEAILMTMVRRDASGELTGDGVATLTSRTLA